MLRDEYGLFHIDELSMSFAAVSRKLNCFWILSLFLYFISIYYCYNYYYYYNHHHHTVVPETDLLLNGEKLCQGKKHHIQASGISSKISVLRRRNVKKKLMKFLVKG